MGHWYRETVVGYYAIHPFYLVYELFLKSVPDRTYIRYMFKKHMGYALDLENPRTFNEKINWLKLFDRTDLHTISADKFRVREYIAEKIGAEYLIPLVLETRKPNTIRPENLPDYPFIIKTNHNSSGGIIVRDKSGIDWKMARFHLRNLLRENYFYASREWQYKHIVPRIVVEKLLTDSEGNIPYDYKLHCFNGRLVFTQVDLDRHTRHTRNLYDPEWNLMPCIWKYENGVPVARPKMFDKMVGLAEKIAPDFSYVRVDFYTIGDSIYFGELTFHSESGWGHFTPEEFDLKLGAMLELPAPTIRD